MTLDMGNVAETGGVVGEVEGWRPDARMAEAAAVEFEPWVRGKCAKLTPAALQAFAERHFVTVFLASEALYKSKQEMADIILEDEGEFLDGVFADINAAVQWLQEVQGILKGAQCRWLAAGSYAVVQDAA